MKVNATIMILTISLIKPFKQKPESHHDKQACGDWQYCMEKAHHFKIVSNSSLEKFAKILTSLACAKSFLGGFLPNSRYIVIW